MTVYTVIHHTIGALVFQFFFCMLLKTKNTITASTSKTITIRAMNPKIPIIPILARIPNPPSPFKIGILNMNI